ncbi:MAG: glycosyltransferase, partial [Candidatus Auribacterota bacterium]|nr:glycosyltransferase [Candidatus Auribacterota bacterium]
EGKEMVTFETFPELREKIEYYLKHDIERKEIARAAYERLQRGKHTIRDRVGRMLEIIKK